MTANVGETVSKFHENFLPVEKFGLYEWFRPPDFIPSPASHEVLFKVTYKFTRPVELLNLGNRKVRDMIAKYCGLSKAEFDADEQYSGRSSNLKVQKAIAGCARFNKYDGTILTESLIESELKDDLAGPEEVVLFISRLEGVILLDKFRRVN